MTYNGKIALQAANGQYACAEGGGGQVIVANRNAISAWEIFTMIDVGNGKVALQAANGQYVCAEGGGGQHLVANRGAIGDWEKFKLIDRGNGQIALQVASGHYVCAEGGGGQLLVANRGVISTWEIFKVFVIPADVVIYEHANYEGGSRQLSEGRYDMYSLGIGNDQLSSLRVPKGMKVTLFEHAGFSGRSREFTEDTPWVGDFNDLASSIVVERSPLAVSDVATGVSPNVLVFDGTAAWCEAQLNVSETAYTVSIWFKTTQRNCGLFSVDAGQSGSNGNDRHIWLQDGALCTRIWNHEVIRTGRNTFADGAWHKVTHVYGGAIGGQRIYVDGQLEAKGVKASSDFNWQDGINVGFSNDAANPYFMGEISEVSVWGIARSEREMMLREEVLTGAEPGLLAYWNFKDGKGDRIVDRSASKTVLTVKGNARWQKSNDFSGVFTPVVRPEEISAIREAGQQLAGAAQPLSNGYKINQPAAETAKPISQLVSTGGVPQYEVGKQMFDAVKGGKLTLTKDLLGNFGQVADMAGGLINALITIDSPSIRVVKITPGVSGEDGVPFNSDLASDVSLATIQSTALKISGGVTLLSTLNVQLKYAEFSQLRGKPYGVIKFVINNSLGIATFLPGVPLLDAMEIDSPVIILSSSGDVKDGPLNAGLVKGLNFFGRFKVGESGNKQFRFIGGLLGIPEINLQGAVDLSAATPAYLMQASIPIEKYIIDGANFKMRMANVAVGVSIKGKPLEPALLLSNQMIVTLKKGSEITNLLFTGGLKLEAESVTGAFTMQAENTNAGGALEGTTISGNEWKEPFGIPGITIRELALQAGLTYAAPWIDNVGVHGNLKIGDVDGTISVLVDANDPDQFVLAGSTPRLTIFQIMSCMSAPTFVAYQAVPASVKKVLDKFVDLNVEDVKINIAPSAASIGAIDFEEGITLKGKLNAWGWNASMKLKVDYTEGLDVEGRMDNINLANVLKITGAQNDPNPALKLKLSPKEIPDLLVTGKVDLLGLVQELQIKANENGFIFYFDRSIPSILEAKLNCSFGDGGNLTAGGNLNFRLNASIPSPFGTIPLVDVALNALADLKAGPRYGFQMTVSGGFSFWGKSVTMPTLQLNVSPADFNAVYNAVIRQITNNAATIFQAVFGTLAEWANAVKQGVIQYSGEIATVAKNVYGATEQQVIAAYKTLNKGASDIARGLKNVYGYSGQAAVIALKGAGYAVNEVGSALRSAYGVSAGIAATTLKGAGYAVNDVGNFIKGSYGLSEQAAATALKAAGYGVNEVGGFIKGAYKLSAVAAASALKGAGYAVSETGNFVKNAYGLGADALKAALSGAGYANDQIKGFFQSLGGSFAKAFEEVGKKLDPTKW